MRERRLIDDASVGSTHRALLHAGREASPTAMSKQQLLDALLPKMAATAAGQGALEAKSAGMLKLAQGASLWKAVTLGVLSVVAGSTLYSSSTPDDHTAIALISAPQEPLATPVVPSRVEGPAQQIEPEPQGLAFVPEDHRDGLPAAEVPARPARHPKSADRNQGRHRAASTHRARRSQTQKAAPSTAPAVAASLRSTTPSNAATSLTAPSDAAEPVSGVDTSGAASSAEQTAAGPLGTQLAEELRQLDAVRQAVHALDQRLASRLLRAYWAAFPEGHLAPEARRLRARITKLPKGDPL